MWDLLWQLAVFFLGITIGKTRATNADITNQTAYMQDLINEAYRERDESLKVARMAEEKAESWERRYWALIEAEQEEAIGS